VITYNLLQRPTVDFLTTWHWSLTYYEMASLERTIPQAQVYLTVVIMLSTCQPSRNLTRSNCIMLLAIMRPYLCDYLNCIGRSSPATSVLYFVTVIFNGAIRSLYTCILSIDQMTRFRWMCSIYVRPMSLLSCVMSVTVWRHRSLVFVETFPGRRKFCRYRMMILPAP